MEIVKQDTLYLVKDSLENGWIIEGTVSKNSNHSGGTLQLHITVLENNSIIGNFDYRKPIHGNNSWYYDISETLKEEFTSYTNTLIDFVLNYIETDSEL